MLGWEYLGPFDEFPAQQHEFGFPEEVARITRQSGKWPAKTAAASHKVISGGDDVTETEGTGIVHTAPGCGQIDYRWGEQNGLPPVAPIGDDGCFHEGFGPLVGKNAADPATAEAVFEELKKKDRLFASERYVHRYPHCWRCKTELLYRLVDEWFIDMGEKQTEEGFRGDIMKVVRNPEVKFLPESINGTARELDWLKNMGDWMISKKRFWGLSLPIWVDEKDPTDFEVMGSREELKARAVEGWEAFEGHTPHRPWVDRVKIRNPRTGNLMVRITDVGNPWLDAGIVAFSTMKYNQDRAYWEKWYPADFITESFPGQFRNWFYALLALSTMMSDGQPPFKTLLGHGLVRDQYGQEMHKSAGNSIEFVSAADAGGEIRDPKGKAIPFNAIGADVMRWLYCRQNPAANLNFGPEPADEVRSKVFFKLWNTYAMFCNYAIGDKFDAAAPPIPTAERQDVDRWLLSNLQLLVKEAHAAYGSYSVMAFALKAEEFIAGDLSNWYVRRNKDRLHSRNVDLDDAGRKDKQAAYQTLFTTLRTLCQILAPCIPFATEAMWKNLRLPHDPASVHLCDFPIPDPNLIDNALSQEMAAVQQVISLGLSARQLAKLNVRQPLAELIVSPGTDDDRSAVERFQELIRDELNVKAVRLHDSAQGPLLSASARLNKKTAAAKLGAKLKEAEAAVAAMDANLLQTELANGPIEIVGVLLDSVDIPIDFTAQTGFCGVAHKGTQVAVDTKLTEQLKHEGLARIVIRQVQDSRKNAGLDLLDKIALYLAPSTPELSQAIEANRKDIAASVQATEWSATPLNGDAFSATVKVESHSLAIELRKV
jgi:isoleucyl-tRNA synthetase